ncbi:unnamed protein product [Amoebophrya sp. A120]|nr:unnamed protein product [Amoebophrya sp. A120]|eukprot:GSA120T00006098001.1
MTGSFQAAGSVFAHKRFPFIKRPGLCCQTSPVENYRFALDKTTQGSRQKGRPSETVTALVSGGFGRPKRGAQKAAVRKKTANSHGMGLILAHIRAPQKTPPRSAISEADFFVENCTKDEYLSVLIRKNGEQIRTSKKIELHHPRHCQCRSVRQFLRTRNKRDSGCCKSS